MITENLSTLKIHKISQAQYDRELEVGNIDASALYLTPDNSDYVTKEYVNNLVSTTINEIANNLSEIAANGSITCGEITTSSDGATITIPNIIGKDNVLLMYLDTTEVTFQKACVCSVSIQGASYLHSIAYDGELYSSDDASLLEYNKTIGSIRLTSAYNEAFRTGKYVYVAW